MQITEITRRNIVDEVRVSGITWHGRLEEVVFLSRLFDLNALPSNDGRFKTMAADIFQHRVNNSDWPDDWVFDDERLGLLDGDDEVFLRFLCETIHPVVRTDTAEVERLQKLFNEHLAADGYEIYESRRISARPVFAARLISAPITIDNEQRITADFVREQLRKCDAKLASGDLDGAITSSRSLVEGVLGEIYSRCTGERLPSSGDLLADYRKVKDLLNLSEDQQIHDWLKGVIRGFNGVIQSIDTLSNKMGDRHRPTARPERHHAKLVVDSAKTLADFLYSTLEHQTNKRSAFVENVLAALNSDARFLERDDLVKDPTIAELLAGADTYLRRMAKDDILSKYSIDSYRMSDIFYAAMRIFIHELTVSDVVSMYVEAQRNSQAIGWKGFEGDLENTRPGLLGKAMDEIYAEPEK